MIRQNNKGSSKMRLRYCIVCKSLDCRCKNPTFHKQFFWGAYEDYAREADLSAICDMLKFSFEKKIQYLKLRLTKEVVK